MSDKIKKIKQSGEALAKMLFRKILDGKLEIADLSREDRAYYLMLTKLDESRRK